MPKIIKQAVVVLKVVQRTQEVQQIQYVDEMVDEPVMKQRQVPIIQKAQRTIEVPQIEYVDNHVNGAKRAQANVV